MSLCCGFRCGMLLMSGCSEWCTSPALEGPLPPAAAGGHESKHAGGRSHSPTTHLLLTCLDPPHPPLPQEEALESRIVTKGYMESRMVRWLLLHASCPLVLLLVVVVPVLLPPLPLPLPQHMPERLAGGSAASS